MKKILTFIFALIILIFLSSCVIPSIYNKEEYVEMIGQLENEIADLEKQIEEINTQKVLLDQKYEELLTLYESYYTKEELYEWFNTCDIYAARSNVYINTKHSKVSFGFIETSSKNEEGCGFVFATTDGERYLLTTYDVISEDGFSKHEYTIKDAFGMEHQASLYNSSIEYNLAILVFEDTTGNDLYNVSFSHNVVSVGEPVCNIYTISSSTHNSMNFSNVVSVEGDNFIIKSEKDVKPFGAMCIDMNGLVTGIIFDSLESGYQSLSSVKILEYLSACGFQIS